ASASSGAAAPTSLFVSDASTCGSGPAATPLDAGGGAAGACRLRPPGVGRSTVRSLCPDPKNVSSALIVSRPSNRPELNVEAMELAADVDRESAGMRIRPVWARAIELEVREVGVIRDLSRRDRQRPNRHTGKLRVHEVADLLDGADLRLRRESAPQLLRRHIGAHGEHEARRAEQRAIRERRRTDTVARLLQRNLNGRLL